MTERFSLGSQVLTRTIDPSHHTRLPRYARGAVGTVIEAEGRHPLPDDRARGLPSENRTVYAVRFRGRDLFGEGDHTVVLALWEDYLTPVPPAAKEGD